MSVVNGLPTELLVRIFYLGTHWITVDGRPYTPLPFPVIASHVCRLWRCVAVGSPSLWTTITFSDRPPYDRSKLWIERSKSLPIEIQICSSSSQYKEISVRLDHLSTILDIIVPHVTRWRKLTAFVGQDVCMDNVLTRLAQCAGAPLLENLTLRNPGSFRPKLSLVPFHGNAPRLSYVFLQDVSIGWSSSLLHDLVGFKLGLTRLAMAMRPSWVDFSRILRDSPRLTYLELVHSGPADWQDEPIELPSLENLSLTNNDPIYVSSLFRLLSMPNLKKLSLDLYGGDHSEVVCQLATQPRSVLSTLRYLKIGDLSCHSSTINVMCEQLTNLKTIRLKQSNYKPFFAALTAFWNGVLYCPNLTRIVTPDIPGQEMSSFVIVRAMGGIPIKLLVRSEKSVLDEEDEN